MRHIRFMLIASVIALLSATTAQANVIYSWVSTSPGTYMPDTGTYLTGFGGELVITDAAYRSGSIDFDANGQNVDRNPETGQIINSPVIKASLYFPFSVSVEPGSLLFFEDDYVFSSKLTFNDDGTLSGSMFMEDFQTEVTASGTHDDWTLYNYGSDAYDSGLCGAPTCSGGSGYWGGPVRVRVPEPPVWPLFGLGVLGLFGLLRLRRKV